MRLFFLLLLLMPLTIFTACGGSSSAENGPASDSAKPVATESPTPEPTPSPTPTPEPVPVGYQSPDHAGDAISQMIAKKFNRGSRAEKKIALTFDDGPHPRRTPQILAALQDAKVTATFFWLGNMVEKYPNIARMVDDAGFEVGSHSWSHAQLDKISLDEVRKEIVGTQDLIEQTIGKRPRLFRPPYGRTDAKVVKICEEEGVVICMWSVDTVDWKASSSPASIQELVAKETGNGSVILMHDIQDRTVEALPALLHQLKAAGFEFVPLSELILESVRLGEEAQSQGDGPAPYDDSGIDEELVIPLGDTGF